MPAMKDLLRIAKAKKRNIIGLMSGTSMDGVDALFVRFQGSGADTTYEIVGHHKQNYPPELRDQLASVAAGNPCGVETLCRLNYAVGEVFAEAANHARKMAPLTKRNVDVIASHGQTLWHAPQAEAIGGLASRSSLQIGEPSIIAKRTGVLTVADFRGADIAAGGQGAPLVPYAHWVLFQKQDRSVAVQNIGGIANVTVLPKDGKHGDVWAFDTGPGNMLIDILIQQEPGFAEPFDRDGQIAASGTIQFEIVSKLLEHPFWKQTPPKSAGRELFLPMIEQFPSSMSLADKVATATALTARSIYLSYEQFIFPHLSLDEVIVAGGGANNNTLMQLLSDHFQPIRVVPIDTYNIASEVVEPLSFAILANETLGGNPASCPKATGASQSAVLGKICFP